MSDSSLEKRLAEIEARVDGAKGAPWVAEGAEIYLGVSFGNEGVAWMQTWTGQIYAEGGHTEDDAEFIAHAREDVPWLIDRVRTIIDERDVFLSRLAQLNIQHEERLCTPTDQIEG